MPIANEDVELAKSIQLTVAQFCARILPAIIPCLRSTDSLIFSKTLSTCGAIFALMKKCIDKSVFRNPEREAVEVSECIWSVLPAFGEQLRKIRNTMNDLNSSHHREEREHLKF